MPFGWGANPNERDELKAKLTEAKSPMPFGWGANPNTFCWQRFLPRSVIVTNAFRLGG